MISMGNTSSITKPVDRKSIVLLIDSLTQGGAQRQIVGLAILLKEKGFGVNLLTYHDDPFYADILDKKDVSHYVIPKAKRPLARIIRVRRTLKRLRPDVIISFLNVPNILACLARLTGVHAELIVSERNTTQRISYTERIKFSLYRYADHIVPNSYSQAKFISRCYPKLIPKITVITNFTDTAAFAPDSQKQTIQNKLRVIGVGRTEKQKNIARLIDAVCMARANSCQIEVDWYGRMTGDMEYYLQKLKDSGLNDYFRFHSPTCEIAKHYQEADLFCLPSLFEGYPNVLCEAMASGLPVICSNVCDNPDIIEEGKNGFLFDPTDTQQMAETLTRFYHMPLLQRKAFGEKSRQLAEQKFGEKQFIDRYISLIEC